ncbi:heavy metal translocating P-type ATPase [Marinobacter halodurans]|uniref:Heavy metal translocating P-type ATPase n=1 Tax=Marinobacter halodurans TaxID=2528979 RepID=A0ABY1ZSW4_9GAMM|nr:heavy metal translocating P-type ATPase [Marinobacter halodurans]TBW59161.1 heavy metal translocating P-type ATPase [Marinobacter halodurans]
MAADRCYHCGEPVAANRPLTLEVEGTEKPFCCAGCRAVFELIRDEGLAGFYRHRTATPATPRKLTERDRERLAVFDHPAVQADFVGAITGDDQTPLREAQLLIEGLSCAACIWLLEHHLARQPGVRQFTINHSTQRARLVWNPADTSLSTLLLTIHELGYGARPYQPDRAEALLQREKRSALIRLCVAGAGTMQSMMLAVPLYFGLISGVSDEMQQFFRWVSLLVATPVVFYSARPFFRNARRDLRARHLTMDVPVALAIGLAYAASAWVTAMGGEEVYFESVCMFTFFLSLGRYIEMQARYRAGLSGGSLNNLTPAIATRRRGDTLETVPVHALRPGDMVEVKPGDVIPADGVMTSGHSTVNEAALTGEYLPEERGPGSPVHAGAINGENPITLRVERTGRQTRLSSILRILDRVQSEKPPVGQFADRLAGRFVSRILVIAPLVGLGWWLAGSDRAFDIALAVLVVTCPCALSLATPTALTMATVSLRRAGFLPTRGHTLEALNRIDTVVFDKTGTLTEGRLALVETYLFGDLDEHTCLALAGGLEQYSEHPIAAVFKGYAAGDYPVTGVTNHLSGGLGGLYRSEALVIGHAAFVAERTGIDRLPEPSNGLGIFLALGHRLLARFTLDDRLRADAATTLQQLQALGLQTVLLSGDRSRHVERIAGELSLDQYRGQASPEDKLAFLRTLEEQGHHVMVVGDGLNDLPVMAGAEVSVAMGNAADLTRLKADAVLLNGQLQRLVSALRTARRMRRIIRQNMGWAVAYNLCALPLAAAGLVPPWLAALGMSLSSLVVVINAVRLGRGETVVEPTPATGRLEHRAQPDTVS